MRRTVVALCALALVGCQGGANYPSGGSGGVTPASTSTSPTAQERAEGAVGGAKFGAAVGGACTLLTGGLCAPIALFIAGGSALGAATASGEGGADQPDPAQIRSNVLRVAQQRHPDVFDHMGPNDAEFVCFFRREEYLDSYAAALERTGNEDRALPVVIDEVAADVRDGDNPCGDWWKRQQIHAKYLAS